MFKKPFGLRRKEEIEDDDVDPISASPSSATLIPIVSNVDEAILDSSASILSRHKSSIDNQFKALETGTSLSSSDPLGLNVIHSPLEDRRVDIIFVHGLGGTSRRSWSHNHDLAYFWPQIFLPNEPVLKEARLLTFGYDAGFRPGKAKSSTVSILDFAKDLLYDLRHGHDTADPERRGLRMGEKPIIFVAHSMGGLIIKEAYMRGQHDPMFEGIIKSVTSMIFLSTPHRGTNLAELLNRILQVSFMTKPFLFIAEMTTGSQTLRKLNEEFRHVAPNLQIVSFYETRPTPVLKKGQIMVLDKDSSVLGYPGEISRSLDADHHGVAKFESPTDPRYIIVRNVLSSLIAKEKVEARDTRAVVHDDSKIALKDYLSVPQSCDTEYNFFRDRWVPGTCEWILRDQSFITWLHDFHAKPRVLWIHGNAASGKSVLSSFLIDNLIQQGYNCSYFFIRSTDRNKRGVSMLLRSLACQLADAVPAYAEQLRQLEATATDIKTTDPRNSWQWLFKQTLFRLDIPYCLYWIIDGLDEAESPGSIIKLFSELTLAKIPIRALFVSRKTHTIASAIQKLGRDVHVESIRTEGNHEDFQSYINKEMDFEEGPYKQEIISQLLDRSRGNFLWVHLAVQKINACHTRLAVEEALKDLPPGMEALYNRMAASIQAQSTDQRLGLLILGWATCSQRPLSLEEFSDALGNNDVLGLHRAIDELCGGFVVVDQDGKLVMIHETAREYLMRGGDESRPLTIGREPTNDILFKRCIARLSDQSLRARISRNQSPALLDYAVDSWFIHLSQGTVMDTEILETAVRFLRGNHILTWIYVTARQNNLNALVAASRYLKDLVLGLQRRGNEETLAQLQAIQCIEGWATDLIKIVGKFGNGLTQHPDSIYRLVPPFCPKDSQIYQQFGRKESKSLYVSGFLSSSWDDCLARFPLEHGAMASRVIAAGSRIIVLATVRKSTQVFVYNSSTFEERRRLAHPERILAIQINKLGDTLVIYGYLTTKVWDLSTGNCQKTVKNPKKRTRPHAILFTENDQCILVVDENRCIRSFHLNDDVAEWTYNIRIEDKSIEGTTEGTTVNAPLCASLSPNGNMVAFGYRGHPPSVWEIGPLMLLGQCNMSFDATDMTNLDSNWLLEVFQILWHPYNDEVIGLTQLGLLFKWDPYEEEPNATVPTGATHLTISQEGSIIATGDAVGAVKIFATTDLSLLYSLSSQEPVLSLAFSIDSKRLYDMRGVCGNVWEPTVLMRLASSSEYADQNSDAWSETESLARFPVPAEHHIAPVDSVIALSGQSVGPLYCYGTEDGVVVLGEAGCGKICELERLTSYMSIEQIVWSEDGRLVAFVDLSGRLSVKIINKEGKDGNTWHVNHGFDLALPSHQGHVGQLVFHPSSPKLFASTPSTLYCIDLDSHETIQAKLSAELSGKVKWMIHPTLPDFVLGFGIDKLHVFDCAHLQEREVKVYSPPIVNDSNLELSLTTENPVDSRSNESTRNSAVLGRVVSNVDSPHVLLTISHTDVLGHHKSDYLIFNIDDIHLEFDGNKFSTNTKELRRSMIPSEIASRIREPLGFLSRGRLAFLDIDRWVCTCRLLGPQRGKGHGSRALDDGTGSIEQYYFLPGDWLTANEAHLCTIMPDGTLLCPRTGDVATVQFSKLRK